MAPVLDRIPRRWLVGAVRGLFQLPKPVRGLLAGRPLRSEGQQLDPDLKLLLALVKLEGYEPSSSTPQRARELIDENAPLTVGSTIRSVEVRELTVDGRPARLYTPIGLAAPSPLLVYYHGGGWVVGSLDSHDNTCRFLAEGSGARVLSVDYRLAPEHPFPAAVDDAVAAFDHALGHAAELGADPGLVAVGGDSAGGNLAAVVCHQTALRGGPTPAFALLFYPVTDLTVRRATRDRYGKGFFLTDADISYFADNYVADHATRADPRCSVLLAEDLSGFPPTYLATAGFDPLRDEGEELATRLRAAGVAVALRRHPNLIHGFVSFLGIGPASREATAEAAGALRAGFAVAASKAPGR
ncbi:MAG TPA: alpha/beta hydrolase [Pseudonocardiaceae bacterium]|jgi:acetyl esterase|nr:alpha/beta hydrolase [Pseudonocardiaceae bacterium]